MLGKEYNMRLGWSYRVFTKRKQKRWWRMLLEAARCFFLSPSLPLSLSPSHLCICFSFLFFSFCFSFLTIIHIHSLVHLLHQCHNCSIIHKRAHTCAVSLFSISLSLSSLFLFLFALLFTLQVLFTISRGIWLVFRRHSIERYFSTSLLLSLHFFILFLLIISQSI